jgi:HSP20 family protein
MSILRYDPFRELDRLTEQLLPTQAAGSRSFPMDAYRGADRFYVHLDLPGIDPDSISLTSEQNVLTIEAERRFERRDDDELLVMERPQGTFRRQLFLSESLDADEIEASYENGVLTLEIPVAEEAKPRRIEISRGESGRRTIEGSASRTS